VDQHIPESHDAMPVDFRMSRFQFLADSLCRFGQDLQVTQDGILDHILFQK
jgi:hypothetical protein